MQTRAYGQTGLQVPVSTKVGHGVDAVRDWTHDCIVQGVAVSSP